MSRTMHRLRFLAVGAIVMTTIWTVVIWTVMLWWRP